MDIEEDERITNIQSLVHEMNVELGKIHDIVSISLIFISKTKLKIELNLKISLLT